MVTTIPIQDLCPSSAPPLNTSIRAVVTLIWPYSSSTQQCALLLAEPDFRLRTKKGQVRVVFSGASARALAKRRLGIGDAVVLDLEGAKWKHEDDGNGTVQTPGNSVGELIYGGKLGLRVVRGGGEEEVVSVNAEAAQETNGVNESIDGLGARPQKQPSAIDDFRRSFGSAPSTSAAVYSSPAFLRKSRLSVLESLDNTYEGLGRLFRDDDLEMEQSPRKRARVSIGEVRDWRMVSRTPSPIRPSFGPLVDANGRKQDVGEDADDMEVDGQEDLSEVGLSSPTPVVAPQASSVRVLGELPTAPDVRSSGISALEQLANSALDPGLQLVPDPVGLPMPPPSLPRLRVPSSPPAPAPNDSHDKEGPSTPHLQPIPSAGLPLPSPFPADASPAQHLLPSILAREVPDSHNEEAETLAASQAVPQTRLRKPAPDTYVDDEDKLVSSSPQRAPQSTVVEARPPTDPLFGAVGSTRVIPDVVPGQYEGQVKPSAAAEDVKDNTGPDSDFHESMNQEDDDEDEDASEIDEDDIDEIYDADELEGEEPSEESSEEYEESDEDEDTRVPDYVKYTGSPSRAYANIQSSPDVEEVSDIASSPVGQSLDETAVNSSRQLARSVSRDEALSLATTILEGESNEVQSMPRPDDSTVTATSQSIMPQQTPQRPSALRRPTEEVPVKTPVTRIVSGFARTAPLPRPQPDFGMDGAIPDPITPIVLSREKDPGAPLSAHGRVMKKALRSLFGFRNSQSPTKDDVPMSEKSTEREAAVETQDLTTADEPGVTQDEEFFNEQVRSKSDEATTAAAIMPQGTDVVSQVWPEPESLDEVDLPDQPASALEEAPKPSGVQVIDLGSSSDFEKGEDPTVPASQTPRRKEQTDGPALMDVDTQEPSYTMGPTKSDVQALQSPGVEDPFILTGPEEERRRSEHAILDESPLQERFRDQMSPLFSPIESEHSLEELPASSENIADASFSIQVPDAENPEYEPIQVDHDHYVDAAHCQVPAYIPSSAHEQDSQEKSRDHHRDADNGPLKPSATSSFQVLSSSPLAAASEQAQDRADDVEMLDLSQAEPEPSWVRVSQAHSQFSMQQSQQSRRTVVDDSVDSSQTSIVAESSSRPMSRDTAEDFSQTTADLPSQQRSQYLGFANSVMPSQELGSFVGATDNEAQNSPFTGYGEVPPLLSQRDAYTASLARSSSPSVKGDNEIEPTATSSSSSNLHGATVEQLASREASPSATKEQQEGDELLDISAQSQLSASKTKVSNSPSATEATILADALTSPGAEAAESQAQSFSFETQLPHPESDRAHLPPLSQTPHGHSGIEAVSKPVLQSDTAFATAQQKPQETPGKMISFDQMQPPKTPQRKSLKSRLSNVPDVISAWFSPKRSSAVARQVEDLESADETQVEKHIDDIRHQASGYSTAHSYYTSLASLERHLNPPSQKVYGGPSTVDVLAVVTDFAKPPERAKGGPRDYFTIFHITDLNLPRQSHIRVEVFRPWKAVLPAADVGDVVLLRSFLVKSRKRQLYLLSTDASAWCVWRFREQREVVENEETEEPAWTRRRAGSDVREEVKGPPVEYGEAERTQVSKLRDWWLAYKKELETDGSEVEGGGGGDGAAKHDITAEL